MWGRALSRSDDLGTAAITVDGLPQPEDLVTNDDACVDGAVWKDFRDTYGDGPVPFALTFPVSVSDLPTGLEWVDESGRSVAVSLRGSGPGCEDQSGPIGTELVRTSCWHVVTLDEQGRAR